MPVPDSDQPQAEDDDSVDSMDRRGPPARANADLGLIVITVTSDSERSRVLIVSSESTSPFSVRSQWQLRRLARY